ncbi:hypothetical protein H2199_002922 [Coniosporium tulheliwenetii]|uniref:Uncharacterized protein n=1 Tax=Coniosporium tulheliwenetii TaxID=3383036 RepID=A0ACC2ZF12_9PEZI|nr:hypothetical protein H2199_002922 [Cladosporium sp. JES 115]
MVAQGSYTVLFGALVFSLFAFVVYSQFTTYLARRQIKRDNGCKPPQARYAHKDPFFGLDFLWENIKKGKEHKLLENSQKRFARLGNTFTAKMFFMPVIATIEPENVKTILSLKFKDFSLGPREEMLGPLLGRGIFTTDGERWQHSRHMIRPNFARDQVADLQAFERHIKDLFKLLPRDGSTVDLQDLFFRFTIDSATEFLFGQSTHTLREDGKTSGSMFANAFNHAQHDVMMNIRLQALRHFKRDPKAREAIKFCHDFVDQFVDQAVKYRETHDLEKAAPEEKYLFLHELARQTTDRRRLRDELLNVLLAGRDTTASLLSNMFWQLAKRPDVWEKLQAEVAELDGQPPSYTQLRNMKYLKYCLNESPLFVKKGTLVMYNPWSMHRRKDFYGPDADEYRPERWETLRPGWEYLPFNGGPRICLGQQYALTEAGYVTTRILQEFKGIESRDPEPWQESLTLTLCSRNGTKVSLTPR